uniref:Uncharacterized protein n=1 Tax=Lactuca sativa TaxID=4236 RepID=A0A9R1URQ4_LACSA|nr:hypothetical protein LSAT_V11C800435840 [Lactuca sativa]
MKNVPNLSYLKVWGRKSVVRLTKLKRKTLGKKESNDSMSANTVIESRNAIFDEDRFTSILRPRNMIQQSFSKNSTHAEDISGGKDIGKDIVPKLRMRTRARKGTRDATVSQHEYCFIIEEGPKTFSEAMASKDVHFWKEAIQDETYFIMHNHSWVLSDLSIGCKIIM